MNTRPAIQPSTDPNVLSVSFSPSRKRFIASLSDGLRVCRTDNCLATCQPQIDGTSYVNPVIAISEVLDDRYLAYVTRENGSSGSSNVVVFWDCLLGKQVSKFDCHEPILGLRLSRRWMVVILAERTIVFAFQQVQPQQQPTPPPETAAGESAEELEDEVYSPNAVHALYPTSFNPFALASLRDDLLVIPAQSAGQVQLVPLKGGSKRIIRAHNSSIRQLSLSADGTLLATASETGTLVRVFFTTTTDQVAEFRRGMEKATVYSLAFSPASRWLAFTSDKGTLHIFDLRPPAPATAPRSPSTSSPHPGRRTPSYAQHRLSSGMPGSDKDSALSGRSSATPSTAIPPSTHTMAYQGSVQEYYGLRPPPTSSAAAAGRETAMTAMTAFKASSWAPKALKDTRSVASAAFWMGTEGPQWQHGDGDDGGAVLRWTTTPAGVRKRVSRPVVPLPNDPSGRPMKGVVGFAPASESNEDDEGAVVYVLGGGREGRWEMFDLVPVPLLPGGGGTGWALVRRGFRRFLGKQFVD